MAQIPQQQVVPFDLGAPPPELPQGDSNLPNFSAIPESQVRKPGEGMDTPTPEWMAQIQQYSSEQQAIILEWWPKIWNRPSKHLDGKLVLNIAGLFLHIESENKENRPRSRTVVSVEREAQREDWLKRYAEWEAECKLRNEWLEKLHIEWKGRVKARKQAMRLWDEHVRQAHEELMNARAFPPPPRPEKPF
jgi:hypothetical protein